MNPAAFFPVTPATLLADIARACSAYREQFNRLPSKIHLPPGYTTSRSIQVGHVPLLIVTDGELVEGQGWIA